MGKRKKYNPNSTEAVFKRLYGVKPDTLKKRILKKAVDDIQYIVVDVTESPIQRSKRDQKAYYSGKKNDIR